MTGEHIRIFIEELLLDYNVDFTLAGHVHSYYRTCRWGGGARALILPHLQVGGGTCTHTTAPAGGGEGGRGRAVCPQDCFTSAGGGGGGRGGLGDIWCSSTP